MFHYYKKLLLVVLFASSFNLGYSQSNQIKIEFIGNCGLHLTDGKSNIYFDFPYKSGAFGYMKYNSNEIDSINENAIFIFTHKHPDHYSKRILKHVLRKRKGKAYGNGRTKKFEQLNTSIEDFKIEVFKTKHRFSFKHHSYLITWHGKRIYFSGDTETSETIAKVKDIDWAFVPVWIITDAKEKNISIDAKKFGIYHLYPTQKVTNSKPEKYIILNNQGEIITIPY